MEKQTPAPLENNSPENRGAIVLAKAQKIACWCLCMHDGSSQKVVMVPMTSDWVARALSRKVKGFFFAEYRGKVTGRKFRISAGHLFFHNSFWPILYGTIDEDHDWSKITYHFDISPITKILTTLILCASLIFAAAAFIQSIFHGFNYESVSIICGPLVVILFTHLAQLIGKIDEVKLLELLNSVETMKILIED